MFDTVVEKVIAEIDQLDSEQQKEVLERLEKKVNGKHQPDDAITPKFIGEDNVQDRLKPPEFPFPPRIVGTYEPKDRTKENDWLRLHSGEYAGQWVALDGDRLVGHGHNLKEVVKTVKQNGVDDALFVRVEPSDALPWAGF